MIDLSREQILDILDFIGVTKVVDKGKDNIQFCCPIHGESNPSAGYSLELQMFNCFSCHAHGDISWLIYRALPSEFENVKDVDLWIKDRYNVDFLKFENDMREKILSYGEEKPQKHTEKRVELPKYTIAPYHSGKATYNYFYERGFTKETMRQHLIGYDKKYRTVTIPIFYENNALAGIIGRYIDPDRPKNKRYKIYKFSTGEVLYLMNKINLKNKTCIVCEGVFDALWLNQLGFENVYATLTNSVSVTQKKFLTKNFTEIIDFSDCDSMGDIFTERLVKLCGDFCKLSTVKHAYPKNCKDPKDCSYKQIIKMLSKKKPIDGLDRKNIKLYED